MKRVLLLAVAAVGAFAGSAHALASATASAGVSLSVDQRAAIDVVSPLVLPTVSTTVVVPVTQVSTVTGSGVGIGGTAVSGTAVSATTTGTPSAPLSNATLTIYGQSGDAVSMAVPESFKVIRTGGTETLTVKTNTNSEYSLGGNGLVMGGTDTMSVNVGGSLAMASNDNLVPGPYEGLLVVVVQYN
jgi:hypothetical protein